jgi:hypothetical protein
MDPGEPCLWLGGSSSVVAAAAGFSGGAGFHGAVSVFIIEIGVDRPLRTPLHPAYRSEFFGSLRAIAVKPRASAAEPLKEIVLAMAGDSGTPIKVIRLADIDLGNLTASSICCGRAPCDIFSLSFAPDSWGSLWKAPVWKKHRSGSPSWESPTLLAGGRNGRLFCVSKQDCVPLGSLKARCKRKQDNWKELHGSGPIIRLECLNKYPGLAVATLWAQGAYVVDLGQLPSGAALVRDPVFARRSHGKSKGGTGKGTGKNFNDIQELKILRFFLGVSPRCTSVCSLSSTLLVISADGKSCSMYAALSGSRLCTCLLPTEGGMAMRVALRPQIQASPLSLRTPRENAQWWTAVWWSAHECEGNVSFSRAGWPL